MKALPSIGARVSTALLWWALLWGAALAGAVWLAVQHELAEMEDDTLRATAEALVGTLQPAWPAPEPGMATSAVARGSGRFVWQVVAHDGAARVQRASSAAPAAPLQARPTAGFSRAEAWRIYGVPLRTPGPWLYVAQTQAERQEAGREVTLAVAAVALPMAALALWWLRRRMRRELAPLLSLSQRLARHDPLIAGATLGAAERQELAPVHDAVDQLAQRLSRRLSHERAFAAHAAHALRTPLAGIDAQLAVALREAPAPLQARLQRVRDAAGRLQRVVAALLSLFRSGTALQRTPLDPAALRTLVSLVPVQGVTVRVQADCSLAADADLVTAALANLLDNAVRHGAGEVRVSTPRPGVLRVDDNGPGVTAPQRVALVQALADENPARPVGLGLMLVALVARAHGGALALPEVAQGFAVELTLDAAAAAPMPAGADNGAAPHSQRTIDPDSRTDAPERSA